MINVNQITSTLRGLPDRALQQYAMMHKGDPYILALAVSESNQRKQMRMAGQGQAGAMPQPKVADAAIAGMAQEQLPEDQGIARIPAPNIQSMADGGIAGYGDGDDVPRQNGMSQGGMYDFAQRSEPVVRMAGGGMAGYMPGFNKTGSVNAAFEAALQKTLGYEGGYVEDDAGKGPSNFGINKSANPDVDVKNLTKEKARELYKKRYWDAIGGDALAAKDPALATVAFDTAVNMGVGKANQLVAASKGNPSTLLGMRQQHYDSLIKKDPEKFAPYAKGWKERVADLATSVIPSAEAGTLPQKQQAAAPADTSTAAQIPGQSVQAPASDYDKTNSFFGRMADKLGIPLEAQRQIGTTLNAPTPLAAFSGAYAAPKAGSSGIAALGEKVAEKLGLLKGPPGSMSKAEIAALQKDTSGLKALEATQQATKEAQAAGATLEEQEYLRKMIEANRASQIPSAANKISDASLLREGQDVATAQRLMKGTEQAQTAGRVDALADKAFPTNNAAPVAGVAPGAIPFKGIDKNELERMQEANQAPMTRDDIVKAAEEVTPVKERKGFSNDDLLTLGLSLLASKSPNFMTALGEAGLATVAGKKEREKIEREEAKLKGSEDLQKAQAKYYEAYAGAIERGSKEKNLELEAEKMVLDNLGKWEKSMAGQMASMNDPKAKQREEERLRTAIYASLGIKPIMTSQSAAPSGGGGFKFLGVN